GAIAAAALANAPAAARRAVWALTLTAAVSLPIGIVAAPAWRVAILPGASAFGQVFAAPISATEPQAPEPRSAAVPVGVAGVYTVGTMDGTTASAQPKMGQWRLMAFLWIAGVVFVLGRMLIGIAAMKRVIRRATPVSASGDEIVRRKSNGVIPARAVSVMISSDVSTPLTFGLLSPVILLPAESEEWSDEHRAVVLRHEMAHIASGDTGLCFGAGVACALYWFHPLVWAAARRLRREQERACDDRVLELGTAPADYAAHLLEVARAARALGMPGFVSVAMARPSQLEGRLLAVLDERGPRGNLSRAARLGGYSASALLVVFISAVQLEAREATVVTRSNGPIVPGTIAPSITAAVAPGIEPEEATPRVSKRRVAASTDAATSRLEAVSDSTVTGFVTVSPGGVLVLDLKTGASVDITGTDESLVRMRAVLGGRDWRNTEISLKDDRNGGARLATYFRENTGSFSSSHHIALTIPRGFSVRVSSSGGGITIRDVNGTFTGSTGGGDITINRASGHAQLSTGGGSVTVTTSNLSGSVSTGGGSVRIQGVTGGVTGSSGGGNVVYSDRNETDVRSGSRSSGQKGPSGTVTTTQSGKTRSTARGGDRITRNDGGDISLTTVSDGADVSTGGGSITIGTANGDLSASTGGGDISVASLRGSGQLSTGAGDVKVNVSGAGVHAVRVTSGSGKVLLTLPADLSATLDIETAYTRGERRPRIDSDWKMNVTETSDWDPSEGTPRRYVQGSATVGSGKGRITVRTVNGDVIIRRSR
ncbi:MAG TPA: M56 family metallopeptidase, partial [Gemmatimonadaceae bacterium]|nr:M56 family metallopeptidase [Gemmatimonadaceae bacterium]